MNIALQKEIVKHIFNQLGVLEQEHRASLIESLVENKFLLDKKMVFDAEDKKYQNNIWGGQAKIGDHTVKILIADIKEDIDEFAIMFQMDMLPIYALRLSADTEDTGSIYFINDARWIAADIALQSKFLYGVESLASTLLDWKKLEVYMDLYKCTISFLNYYASLEE